MPTPWEREYNDDSGWSDDDWRAHKADNRNDDERLDHDRPKQGEVRSGDISSPVAK